MSYLINTNVPVGSALNRLGSLIDVEINNPLGKDVLSYDSTTQTWVNDDSIGNIVAMSQAEYDLLPTEEKEDSKKYYYITDRTITGAPLDDTVVSANKTWSSDKINSNMLKLKLKKTSELTANVQSLTWTQRTGCWTASVQASNYFGSDYQNILAVKITSYNGNPIMTFFDGSTIVFVSWTGTPSGPIKMIGYYNEVEISS